MNVIEMVRGLYEYHRWANRRLFEVATSLGEELAARDVGKQFSYPTVRRMFGHLYGADKIWLARWTGDAAASPAPGDEFTTLGSIRAPWDAVERDQRTFVESLTPADLERTIEFRSMEGQATRVALWPVLQHVANHGTHHRSEIATMMTMLSGSPPDTGIASYLRSTGG